MKKHNGMRPQDIVVILKIVLKRNNAWQMKDLSYELNISLSEISESIHRSVLAGLMAADKKTVLKQALLEFIKYGLKYVFPVKPGGIVVGLPTAHSTEILKKEISSKEVYVIPYFDGNAKGFEIEPLYANLPIACSKDPELCLVIGLIDCLRIGKNREVQLAHRELEKIILC
jgi:hypothetical protein